jgi:chromosome segregation ATPase
MVAARLETKALQGTPQVGRAIATAGARGLVTGATVAGRAGYAQTIRVKPLADRMRAAGVMVGKAREGLSRVAERVRRGVGERASQTAERARMLAGRVRQSERRQEALGNLRGRVEEVARLSRDVEAKRLRLAEAAREVNELEARKRELEAIRELRAVNEEYREKYSEEYLETEEAKVEQQLQQARQKQAQARAEYEATEKALNARMEELKRQIQALEKEGVLTGEESRNLQSQIKIPETALKTLNKMAEDEEYQRQVLKADLGLAETKRDLYRGVSKRLEKASENLRQARNTILSWLGVRGKKEEREETPPAERQKEEDKGAMQWPQWM